MLRRTVTAQKEGCIEQRLHNCLRTYEKLLQLRHLYFFNEEHTRGKIAKIYQYGKTVPVVKFAGSTMPWKNRKQNHLASASCHVGQKSYDSLVSRVNSQVTSPGSCSEWTFLVHYPPCASEVVLGESVVFGSAWLLQPASCRYWLESQAKCFGIEQDFGFLVI